MESQKHIHYSDYICQYKLFLALRQNLLDCTKRHVVTKKKWRQNFKKKSCHKKKFSNTCCFLYCGTLPPIYIKTDFLNPNKDDIIVHEWTVMEDIEQFKFDTISVLVSGHSDIGINDDYEELLNSNLRVWFCQNKLIEHSKLRSLPTGLYYPHNEDYIMRLYSMCQQQKQTDLKLAYLNINADTYPEERSKIVELYHDKCWVTYENKVSFETYLSSMYGHKFVFAPRGNGLDTFRLWEALYLGCIPIVKHHIGYDDFKDLPILFVESWEHITEDFLTEQYKIIVSKQYNFDKLKLSYWINAINTA